MPTEPSIRTARKASFLAGATVLAALVAAVTLFVRSAAADCLASDIACFDNNPYVNGWANSTTSPTYSNACEGFVMNVASASFDVPAGAFHVGILEGGDIELTLRDAFTVTGPAPGTPIALHMRVRVHGFVNWDGTCCPDSQAHVDLAPHEPQPGDPETHWSFGKSSGPMTQYPFADSLDITLQRTAGAPIGIEIHAFSFLHAPSSSDIVGTFSFPDLPQGWAVTSCKGYHREQPVPAAPVSWGSVKAAYR
jgi:hypothetical protein